MKCKCKFFNHDSPCWTSQQIFQSFIFGNFNIKIFNDDEYEFFVTMSNQFDLCWNDFSSININNNPQSNMTPYPINICCYNKRCYPASRRINKRKCMFQYSLSVNNSHNNNNVLMHYLRGI